jgi:hypothetical protein
MCDTTGAIPASALHEVRLSRSRITLVCGSRISIVITLRDRYCIHNCEKKKKKGKKEFGTFWRWGAVMFIFDGRILAFIATWTASSPRIAFRLTSGFFDARIRAYEFC